MARQPEDWAGVAQRLLAGDRAALLKLSRLIASFLARWRAYDFQDEWSDLIQDVLLVVVDALRKGNVRQPEALIGYVASVTRHRLADRLRASRVRQETVLCWPEAARAAEPSQERIVEVRRLLEKLPEKQRALVFGVYGEGRTYEAVALECGVPLGTAKRQLREALATLRRELGSAGRSDSRRRRDSLS